jgi:hypothetical protein
VNPVKDIDVSLDKTSGTMPNPPIREVGQVVNPNFEDEVSNPRVQSQMDQRDKTYGTVQDVDLTAVQPRSSCDPV